jgi:hypothetical protein
MTAGLLDRLHLGGFELAPAQTWSSIRLVPVIRRDSPGDLRLALRNYDEAVQIVSLDGPLLGPGMKYVSYVPHGMVMSWTEDKTPVVTSGANMLTRDGKRFGSAARVTHRMAKREDKRQLRFLPMHLAMEGFLSQHFGGPEIAWTEYSKAAIRKGLSPRFETAASGRGIAGLADALRLFEIHEDQVGVLIFVAEALASIFIVSHPDDYRLLHRSLLDDFYSELMVQYGLYGGGASMQADLDLGGVSSLDTLALALEKMHEDWASVHEGMSQGVISRPLESEKVYSCGPFQLQRFATRLDPSMENHIGETIVNMEGEIEYLKTYRLSAAQTRRAYLLSQLANSEWNLDDAATELGQSKEQLVRRLENAGFGYLLKEHVLQAARKGRRHR